MEIGSPAKRYLFEIIHKFLETRMVFIGGPRQVGKTTLCLGFLEPPAIDNSAYLNWDDIHNRKTMRDGHLPQVPLVVLDEIHKYREWRSLVKGFFDKKKNIQKFLITGSARLDYYRRGGDSLLGRYRYLRLHPLSIAELGIDSTEGLRGLLQFGGFPEPYFSQNERNWKLWNRERLYRIVNDDIRDLEGVRDLTKLEVLAENLIDRIGSPLSVNNIANDLSINFRTAENWIAILERVYYCYRILPFGPTGIKAVKKERKLYLWDWSAVIDPGARFENLVASHLLKYCHYLEDTEGEKMELRFLRDVEKRELDFVILKNKKPLFAVECKAGERQVSKPLLYFKQRLAIPQFFQVHMGSADYSPEEGVRVLPFIRFSKEVGLI